MTSFRVEQFRFVPGEVANQTARDPRLRNWPVVYALNDRKQIYVGESLNVAARFRQHLESDEKRLLDVARVVVDETFNKSACLDLESYLIRLLAGDGRYLVLNRNEGITNADYYGRAAYQETFKQIFDDLFSRGLFGRSIPEIENSDLFKLSPFKALTEDQAAATLDIVEGLFSDLEEESPSRIVIQGEPGTGKTVVGVYLMKLLSDIKNADLTEPQESDSVFAEFFVEGYPELLRDFRMGLVVPQQSLRASVKRVFKRTPGLDPSMVLSPLDVGSSAGWFDLLIVDEAHRLSQRASQANGPLNKRFSEIHEAFFGAGDREHTQLDWVNAKSTHQIFLVDSAQSVRPSDIPRAVLDTLVQAASREGRQYRLTSQMRVAAGSDYVGYVRQALSDEPPARRTFGEYDVRLFDDLGEMRQAILARDAEIGLARMVAGFAWPWRSKSDPSEVDIELDGLGLQWNRVAVDWVSSPGSVNDVGSIHTIQGYDLNYAGVILGPDIRLDPESGRLQFDRANYFDARGKADNGILGIKYTDDEILRFVANIYAVLLTRGIRGTYVYVCDPVLRERFRDLF